MASKAAEGTSEDLPTLPVVRYKSSLSHIFANSDVVSIASFWLLACVLLSATNSLRFSQLNRCCVHSPLAYLKSLSYVWTCSWHNVFLSMKLRIKGYWPAVLWALAAKWVMYQEALACHPQRLRILYLMSTLCLHHVCLFIPWNLSSRGIGMPSSNCGHQWQDVYMMSTRCLLEVFQYSLSHRSFSVSMEAQAIGSFSSRASGLLVFCLVILRHSSCYHNTTCVF